MRSGGRTSSDVCILSFRLYLLHYKWKCSFHLYLFSIFISYFVLFLSYFVLSRVHLLLIFIFISLLFIYPYVFTSSCIVCNFPILNNAHPPAVQGNRHYVDTFWNEVVEERKMYFGDISFIKFRCTYVRLISNPSFSCSLETSAQLFLIRKMTS